MKKKSLVVLLSGVVVSSVLTGCGSKDEAGKTPETQIIEEQTEITTTEEATVADEIETLTAEESEYPKTIEFSDVPEMKYRENGMVDINMSYMGNEFGFATGETDSEYFVSLDVASSSANAICIVLKTDGEHYIVQDIDGVESVYKLVDTEASNPDDDLGVSSVAGDPSQFTIEEDSVSSVIQIDEHTYVLTDTDGYENDITYDSEGYVSMISATQSGMFASVEFGTTADLLSEIESVKAQYIDTKDTFEEMTYSEAINTYADYFLMGFMSLEPSQMEDTDEKYTDDVDYEYLLDEVTPTETDELTGYIYSVVDDAVCVASNDLEFRCVVVDGMVKASECTYTADDKDVKQQEFQLNAIDLSVRVVQ